MAVRLLEDWGERLVALLLARAAFELRVQTRSKSLLHHVTLSVLALQHLVLVCSWRHNWLSAIVVTCL